MKTLTSRLWLSENPQNSEMKFYIKSEVFLPVQIFEYYLKHPIT